MCSTPAGEALGQPQLDRLDRFEIGKGDVVDRALVNAVPAHADSLQRFGRFG
jgi:hypothetical protein